ncbi:MAG: hypothetical protein LBL35_02315 [Clostridiales bacterium]|jgi:hypothetical protein|nr:hypothetical protein [Clostridiales bacterium]
MESEKIINILTNAFNHDFMLSYKSLKRKGKNRLLPHLVSFYRRWFYSAFVENTALSPANLWSAVCAGSSSMTCPAMKDENDGMEFTLYEYSIERHPIYGDLNVLLDSCSPDFSLSDDNSLTPEHEKTILKNLSIRDPYYASYLVSLCKRMGLIADIPSIHSSRAQVTKERDAFDDLSGREKMGKIVESTVSVASGFMSEALPDKTIISESYILGLLQKPAVTDDIFKHIYSALGVSFDDILECGDDYMDEVMNAMLSSTFYLGVSMDRYFFTPFGFYLKFINLGYILPYYIKREMAFALEAIDEANDIGVAMFSPCSHYNVTALGAEYFGLKESERIIQRDEKLERIIALIAENSPITLKTLKDIDGALRLAVPKKTGENIYALKIKLSNDAGIWKTIEFHEETPLRDIYFEICYEFGFDATLNYSFYHGEEESPFLEYAPKERRKRAKNSPDAELKTLGFEEKHKFTLVLYDIVSPYVQTNFALPQKKVKFKIEVFKIKEFDQSALYPNVLKSSKRFKDMCNEWFL